MAEETSNEAKGGSWISNIKLSEAATIAIVPVVAQVILFVYEFGYFSVFWVPITLISFDLGDLFIVTVGLISLAWLVYYYGDLAFSTIRSTSEPVRDKLLRTYGAFLLLVALFFSYGLEFWQEWIPALLVIILTLLYEFAFPIVAFRGKGTYLEKLKAHAEQRSKNNQKKEIEWPHNKLLRLLGPNIVLILIGLYGVYHFGRASAMTQKEFRVASTNPETVVLWMGNDRFIVAPFDRATKTLQPSFQILPVGDNPLITYSLQRIGPLSFDSKAIVATQPPLGTPPASGTPSPSPTITLATYSPAPIMPITDTRPIPSGTPMPTPTP